MKGGGSLGGAPFGTHLWDPAGDCCQGYQEYLKFITNLIKIVAHVGVKGGGSLGGVFGTHLWDPAYDCCQGYQEYLKFITNLIFLK